MDTGSSEDLLLFFGGFALVSEGNREIYSWNGYSARQQSVAQAGMPVR